MEASSESQSTDLHTHSECKVRALGEAISQIEKQFGEGVIGQLSEHAVGKIDAANGSQPSSMLAMVFNAIAECQKSGGVAALIDTKHAVDSVCVEALGVDTNNLLFSQVDVAKADEIVKILVDSNAMNLIFIDSAVCYFNLKSIVETPVENRAPPKPKLFR